LIKHECDTFLNSCDTYILKYHMKQNKTRQLRIRITENQLSSIVQYIIDNPNEFKSQSELIRESIKSRISRTSELSSKTKRKG
jgi:hypothetical protein